MTRLAALAALAALATLAGCGKEKSGTSAPWLTMPDLATHTALYFPIEPGAVHGPPAGKALKTCNYCHGDRSAGSFDPNDATTAPPPAASFKTFSCTICHVEIRPGVFHDDPAALASVVGHPGVAGFDPNSAITVFDRSCRTCHPTGIAVDHAKVFPLPHQNAAGTISAACGDCHLSTDRTVLGCAQCHATVDLPSPATAHARVPDFDPSTSTSASALCARCHGDGTVPVRLASVDPSLAHTAFPIETTGLHVGAAGGACLQCHPAFRSDPHKSFAADFTQPSCTGCHVSTPAVVGGVNVFHDDATGLAAFHTAQNVTNFQFTTTACLTCHPDGSGGAPSYHEQLFHIASGSSHFGIACGDCHGATRSDVASMKCVSCHSGYAAGHGRVLSVSILVELAIPPPANCQPAAITVANADCLMCHGPSLFDPTTIVTQHLAIGDPGAVLNRADQHRSAGCYTCHVATIPVPVTVTPPATPPTSVYQILDYTKPTGTSSPGCATCHVTYPTCGPGP